MPPNDAYTDVVELCALLQCLGFSVKSLDTCDGNASQEGTAKTVVINCQSSGLNVVLESSGPLCSCPATNRQNSGLWQVSGVAGGKQLDKEFGCTLLGSLPKAHRERLSTELQDMIRCIKQFSGISEEHKEANKSASMIELSTPEKRLFQAKVDTPTRYRSLDTLTNTKGGEQPLPAPGPLQRRILRDDDKQDATKTMCKRQSTYTVCPTPGSLRRTRNKTSSPIQTQHSMLDSLMAAEKAAEDLKNKIAFVIREFVDEAKNDSSISSLVLDVSKISVLKGETSKAQFASSPNLSSLGVVKEELPKSRLKRFESASTSNLAPKVTPASAKSKLRRLSPNIFKTKKDSTVIKAGTKSVDAKSKLNSIFKPKIVTPVQIPRTVEASPNLSAAKRKFSYVKSTIPRPSKKE